MTEQTDNDQQKTSKRAAAHQNITAGKQEGRQIRGFPRFLSLLRFPSFVVGKKQPSCGPAFKKGESLTNRVVPFL